MTVIAHMRDGSTVTLADTAGTTPSEVIRRLTSRSLTGSAVPLDDVQLEAVDGDHVSFGAIESLELR